jgi:hypothetical protein
MMNDYDAEEGIQTLVGQEKIYASGERTPGRKHIKPGDWICFYATTKGVMAHARITMKAEKNWATCPAKDNRWPPPSSWKCQSVYDSDTEYSLDLLGMRIYRSKSLFTSYVWVVSKTFWKEPRGS